MECIGVSVEGGPGRGLEGLAWPHVSATSEWWLSLGSSMMDVSEQAESQPSAVYKKKKATKKYPEPCSDPRRQPLCQGAAALGGKPRLGLWRGMSLHLQCEKSVYCPSEENLYGVCVSGGDTDCSGVG